MITLAVLQARMTSTRFPGKVLASLVGEPMILRQLERVSRACGIDALVVATSTNSSDDELAEVVTNAGYRVFRGSLDDVLDRFISAVDEFERDSGRFVDVVVRLTADCPLTSPVVIDSVIETFVESDLDYLSNTMIPTYPDGLDVEAVRAKVLREVASTTVDPHEREHVTLGVYRRDEVYSIGNYADLRNNSRMRWTVDTPDDFSFVAQVYENLYQDNPCFDYEDILDYLQSFPERSRTDEVAPRNAALSGLDVGAMRVTNRPETKYGTDPHPPPLNSGPQALDTGISRHRSTGGQGRE